MSDFTTAVTAVEMALKAFGLEESVSVKMDSEAPEIVLNGVASIAFNQRSTEKRSGRVLAYALYPERGKNVICITDDVVEAVVEAVAHVIAEQAREVLYSVFESVEEEDGFDEPYPFCLKPLEIVDK